MKKVILAALMTASLSFADSYCAGKSTTWSRSFIPLRVEATGSLTGIADYSGFDPNGHYRITDSVSASIINVYYITLESIWSQTVVSVGNAGYFGGKKISIEYCPDKASRWIINKIAITP